MPINKNNKPYQLDPTKCPVCLENIPIPGVFHIHKNLSSIAVDSQTDKNKNKLNNHDNTNHHTCKSCLIHCPKKSENRENTDKRNSKDHVDKKNGADVQKSSRPVKRVKFNLPNDRSGNDMARIKKSLEELTDLFKNLNQG